MKILIGHKKRSGKNFAASYIQYKLKEKGIESEIIHFADTLKEIVADMFQIPIETLEKLKNEEYKINLIDKSISFREILQNFGSGKMKEIFGDNIWANLLLQKVTDKNKIYIIPDFRFKVEYETLLSLDDVITLHIKKYENDNTDNHQSETELDDFEYDYIIKNDFTENFERRLDEFVETILQR